MLRLTLLLSAGICSGGLFAITLMLTGCGPGMKEWDPYDRKPKVYGISHRLHAPQPVYSRVTWVHPPVYAPSRNTPATDAPIIVKTFSMNVEGTLEDAGASLAAAARYSSFVSSAIADRKISVEGMGTIDELAALIASKGGVKVVVDHAGREIRVLRKAEAAAPGPKFPE